LDQVRRVISQARFRLFCQHWLSSSGWCLLTALIVCTVGLCVSRTFGWSIDGPGSWPMGWIVLGAPVAVALLLAPVIAWSRRPDSDQTAAIVDQNLQLKDRLATALYAGGLEDNPYAEIVRRDARDFAGKVRAAQAVAVRPTKVWLAVSALLAILLGAIFAFPQDLLGLGQERQDKKQQARADQHRGQETHKQIQLAKARVKKAMPDSKSREQQEALDELNRLSRLSQQQLADPQMRRRAASKLSSVEQKLSDQVRQKQQRLARMKNTMSRLDPKRSGPADRLASAMRRADFDESKKQLDQLSRTIDRMSDAERQALSEQLGQMSKQLGQASGQTGKAEQINQAISKSLRDAGMTDQQIDELLQQKQIDPKELKEKIDEALKQKDKEQQAQQTEDVKNDPSKQADRDKQRQEQAENLTEKVKELDRARQQETESAQDARDLKELSESLEDLRQALNDSPSPPTPPQPQVPKTPKAPQPPQPPQPPAPQQPKQQQPGQQPGQQKQQQPGQQPGQQKQQQPGQQPGQQKQQQPGQQPGQQKQQQPGQQPGQQKQQQPGQQPSQQKQQQPGQQPGQQKQQQPGQQPGQQKQQQPGQQPGQQKQQQPGQQPGQQKQQQPGQQPGQQKQQQPGQQPGQQKQQQPGQPGGNQQNWQQQFQQAARRTSDRFQQMDQRQRQTQEQADQYRQSQRAVQKARKDISDQDNRFRQADDGKAVAPPPNDKPGTGPGGPLYGNQKTVDRYKVDGKLSPNKKPNGKVIARYLRDGKLPKGKSGVGYNQEVSKAKQAAERAVSEDRVPSRYHKAIKRYFDQLPKTGQQVEGGASDESK